MTPLLLEFRDNGRAHDDLHLWFPGYGRTADTYYFAIDRGIDGEEESPQKAARVLARLLQQWLQAVAEAKNGTTVFLPYDFSDEYTGCLRCECACDDVVVTPGFSRREGWSFSPSDISGYIRSVTDFQPDGGALRVRRDDWVASIEQARLDAVRKGEANQRVDPTSVPAHRNSGSQSQS